jgi:hypothetical protein
MAIETMRRPPDSYRDPTDDVDGVRLGRIVALDARGRPLVTFKGGPAQPVIARLATSDPQPADTELENGPPVLLTFEDADPRRPIIVGFVRETLSARAATDHQVAVVADTTRTVELNGKALIFEGQEEIVLRCGHGSLTIRANGQIVVKGTRLVSRASETNKIRGASVQIN